MPPHGQAGPFPEAEPSGVPYPGSPPGCSESLFPRPPWSFPDKNPPFPRLSGSPVLILPGHTGQVGKAVIDLVCTVLKIHTHGEGKAAVLQGHPAGRQITGQDNSQEHCLTFLPYHDVSPFRTRFPPRVPAEGTAARKYSAEPPGTIPGKYLPFHIPKHTPEYLQQDKAPPFPYGRVLTVHGYRKKMLPTAKKMQNITAAMKKMSTRSKKSPGRSTPAIISNSG